jgi:CheY-like chemotaxis protein
MASVAASAFPAFIDAIWRTRARASLRAFRADASAVASLPAAMSEATSIVVVVGADEALFELLAEWLAHGGYRVLREESGERAAHDRCDVVIVDAPFHDDQAAALLARIARDYPRTPVLMLSSRLFASVRRTGPLAAALGVSGVLPKPVDRQTLVDAVGRLRKA